MILDHIGLRRLMGAKNVMEKRVRREGYVERNPRVLGGRSSPFTVSK